MPDREKYVDEDWKASVTQEKETQKEPQPQPSSQQSSEERPAAAQEPPQENDRMADEGAVELNFTNYITSLIFQAMIFLGEIPNPMNDNQYDRNSSQAKFLIDTLILLRDKTKGNLTPQENHLLDSSIYELEMKYVECVRQEKGTV
ncbi:MAG TPA: DUF1844 domain-containing protein [Candidatus Omnitrophota bacterium]|nr:DUF1844 domain-containing protein [Candidatus Omnitrophota bacterium]HPB68123.1 DUF1844 domain-containing protein [Candidatus Omnitrophota bacterium]HQO57505.1 DUF1844 domain-containing protein [Candidatus Omnitrophota bacterium]HQP12449.1 DUF1844 domain-containing protein [Candidatus Omnitrophota bacterium]